MNLPVLTIASNNPKKVSEISEMLDVLSLKVEKQPEYLNVEETGKTYFENALLKAKAAALETQTWALADDSSLEVDVLDGRPGIYSARYAKTNDEKIKKLIVNIILLQSLIRRQERLNIPHLCRQGLSRTEIT